jgi:hypothetical protein
MQVLRRSQGFSCSRCYSNYPTIQQLFKAEFEVWRLEDGLTDGVELLIDRSLGEA